MHIDADDVKMAFISGGSTLFVLGLLGTLTYGCFCIGRDINVSNYKLDVEKNVAQMNDVSKFTGNAFIVGKGNEKYYAELFGITIENPSETPMFSSYTYEVDKSYYDLGLKYLDINYEYGRDGQLIGAENELRDNLTFWFPKEHSKWANHDLLKGLTKITEEPALMYNNLMTNESLNVQNVGDYEITL